MRFTAGLACLFFLFFLFSSISAAQYRVDDRNRHEKVIAVVPMVGAGTYADPKRPLFAPASLDGQSGIVGYSFQMSDDGKFAIVEFAARSRRALLPILNSGRTDVKAFVKGRDRKEDIELEIKKFKKDFDAEKLSGEGVRGGGR